MSSPVAIWGLEIADQILSSWSIDTLSPTPHAPPTPFTPMNHVTIAPDPCHVPTEPAPSSRTAPLLIPPGTPSGPVYLRAATARANAVAGAVVPYGAGLPKNECHRRRRSEGFVRAIHPVLPWKRQETAAVAETAAKTITAAAKPPNLPLRREVDEAMAHLQVTAAPTAAEGEAGTLTLPPSIPGSFLTSAATSVHATATAAAAVGRSSAP